MIRSAAANPLAADLGDFLYASIGEDNNGMPLSVLSALARLDIDPWVEAATLAGLPEKAAVQRLTSLIESLPNGTPGRQDAAAMAERLTALLPRHASSHAAARSILHAVGTPGPYWTVKYAIIMALMLGAQWMVTSCQPLTLQNAFEQTSTSTPTTPPPPVPAPP